MAPGSYAYWSGESARNLPKILTRGQNCRWVGGLVVRRSTFGAGKGNETAGDRAGELNPEKALERAMQSRRWWRVLAGATLGWLAAPAPADKALAAPVVPGYVRLARDAKADPTAA